MARFPVSTEKERQLVERMVRIIKVHGSVNWFRTDDGVWMADPDCIDLTQPIRRKESARQRLEFATRKKRPLYTPGIIPPMLGTSRASAGVSQKSVRPTTRSPAPTPTSRSPLASTSLASSISRKVSLRPLKTTAVASGLFFACSATKSTQCAARGSACSTECGITSTRVRWRAGSPAEVYCSEPLAEPPRRLRTLSLRWFRPASPMAAT